MTVLELFTNCRVGWIRAEDGKLKIRPSEPERARLELAIETLQRNREALFEAVAVPSPGRWPDSLRALAEEPAAASANPEFARREVWVRWAEWKARGLNRFFQEQDVTGQPNRITATTVEHGENGCQWPISAPDNEQATSGRLGKGV